MLSIRFITTTQKDTIHQSIRPKILFTKRDPWGRKIEDIWNEDEMKHHWAKLQSTKAIEGKEVLWAELVKGGFLAKNGLVDCGEVLERFDRDPTPVATQVR